MQSASLRSMVRNCEVPAVDFCACMSESAMEDAALVSSALALALGEADGDAFPELSVLFELADPLEPEPDPESSEPQAPRASRSTANSAARKVLDMVPRFVGRAGAGGRACRNGLPAATHRAPAPGRLPARSGSVRPSSLGCMDFSPSPRAAELTERVRAFVAAEIDPVEPQYHRDLAALRAGAGDVWTPLPLIAELQAKAREQGLWNLFLPRGARRGVRGGVRHARRRRA